MNNYKAAFLSKINVQMSKCTTPRVSLGLDPPQGVRAGRIRAPRSSIGYGYNLSFCGGIRRSLVQQPICAGCLPRVGIQLPQLAKNPGAHRTSCLAGIGLPIDVPMASGNKIRHDRLQRGRPV